MKKVLSIVLLLITISLSLPVFAESGSPYDTTDVMTDLNSASINDSAKFDPEVYKNQTEGKLITLNEYGWGTDDYSLYAYFYFQGYPNVDYNQGGSSINLNDVICSMEFLSVSEDYCFFKYKIDVSNLEKRLIPFLRLYSFHDATISWFASDLQIIESSVVYSNNERYTYVGTKNPKMSKSYEEDIINLELHSSVYRTNSSPSKDKVYDIFTVYFSIPRSVHEYYDRLEAIEAEWYEYRVEAFVTDRNDVYESLSAVKGLDSDDFINTGLYPSIRTKLYHSFSTANFMHLYYKYAYNYPQDNWTHVDHALDSIDNVVLTSIPDSDEGKWEAIVNGGDLLKQIDRFDEKVDFSPEGINTSSYNRVTFSADDTFDIRSYTGENGSEGSFWKRLFNDLLDVDETNMEDVEIFREVKASDFKGYVSEGDNSALAKKLLINEADLAAFKEYVEAENELGNTVIQFRFAKRTYYSEWCKYDDPVGGMSFDFDSGHLYYSRGTAFLDFDIISLTYSKDGDLYHFVVNSDPIDIWPGPTPPVEGTPLWKYVIGKIGGNPLFKKVNDIIRILKIVLISLLVLVALSIVSKLYRLFRKDKD